MLRVTCADFDQIAVIAGNMMHFEHFGAVREGSRDVLVGRGVVAADSNEREEPEAESLRVDLCTVAAEPHPELRAYESAREPPRGPEPTARAMSTCASRAFAWS